MLYVLKTDMMGSDEKKIIKIRPQIKIDRGGDFFLQPIIKDRPNIFLMAKGTIRDIGPSIKYLWYYQLKYHIPM